MLKKISLILTLVALSITVFSQEKDFGKLQIIFENSDYVKCIEKSKKVSDKYPKEATPFYYIALSNFEQYKTTNRLKKRSFMLMTINNINSGLKKDKEKIDFNKFGKNMQEVHDSILTFANKLWIEDKSQSEYFYKNLVTIYSDTTEQYREIFMPKIVVVNQKLAFSNHSGPINEVDIAGNRQGLWIKKYDDGIVESEINFKDGHPAGIFRKYFTNGNLKANMFFDDKGETAAAILYREEGGKYAMGYYHNHQKDSLWQYFINDSIVISEETYKNGIKNGPERIYTPYNYPNLLEEKYWKNGVQDSTWTRCYTDGSPKFITEYKDGVREGMYVAFNEQGTTIVTGTYKNNLQEGLWKIWDADTQEIIEIEYKNGHPINEKELTEAENKVLQDMEEMRGKIEEPGSEIYNDNNGNDN